ncbi:MAG: FAD-binding domain-containing protein [Rhodoferax sp.]
MHKFEPTLQAAQACLAQVRPDAYAQTRNALDGAVTRLSPYITHGLLSLRDVYTEVNARHPLDAKHKFVFELGWRAYYRHVWAHRGDGIHRSLHAGLLPEDAYQTTMPDDVLQARTGVPAIDLAVCELYGSGYLHNHARMWLASYLVHLRKVHWHTAAQWMLGHLLDGDLASNHLSWQWVAGTGSVKPYLFNAENVAKYAPALWHSPGTVIDTSYEALDRMARSTRPVNPRLDQRRAGEGAAPHALLAAPPHPAWSAPDSSLPAGRDVLVLHPWSLAAFSSTLDGNALPIALGFPDLHGHMPWSALRWHFVTEGLRARTPHLWWGSVESLAHALRGARSVRWQWEAHAQPALEALQRLLQAGDAGPLVQPVSEAPLFAPVDRHCESFAQWWRLSALLP